MKLEINVTKNRSGQSDRHSQICDCQNSINDKFVPDNVHDQTLISRLDHNTPPNINQVMPGPSLMPSNPTPFQNHWSQSFVPLFSFLDSLSTTLHQP